MKRLKSLAIIALLPLVIISCSNVKKKLGMERSQPDEFSVTEGAPLTIPPDFNLMPPKPGAPRPQETKTSVTAQGLVLGTGTGATTTTAAPDGAEAMPAVPAEKVAASSLEKTADADLLSDAKTSATKPKSKSKTAKQSSVLRPTDESKRLQQENINTTISPVMKNAQ